MLALRVDPWAPDHGMGFEAAAIDEPPATADPEVETTDWSEPIVPAQGPRGPVSFVDGVRRVELRLLAYAPDGTPGRGLFGSFAVGAVHCDARASFGEEHEIGRVLVVGSGLRPDPVEVALGGTRLRYRPATEAGDDPDLPLLGLQKIMQAHEERLAERLAAVEGRFVLADGRLGFLSPSASPVVGVVKRFARAYLEPSRDALLGLLGPGERTPLFLLSDPTAGHDRFSWYVRLVALRPPWHDHAGIVRCEVRAGVGLEAARRLADEVTAFLPGFAGRPSDPRFPQNLAPVASLESWLQHRMGSRALVRRTLTAWLTEQGAA
ncbi:MAG: hypothetical protein WEA10_01370 [Actinomycetota bacterium]